MTAFWDIVLCRLVEPLVYFNETTRHYIPEGCHLHDHHWKNLKSHKVYTSSQL
jgi:hypothetical protein